MFGTFFRSRGFTLIELLIVIAIIGILASFIVASMSESRAQARDAERMNDVKQLQVALELYYNRNGAYPTTLSDLAPQFIDRIPTDPRSGENYTYQTENSERDYALEATSDDGEISCQVYTSGADGFGSQDCPFYGQGGVSE